MHDPMEPAKTELPPRPPRLRWMIGLALFSFLMGGSLQRIVPGGPFISVISDILPSVAALISIRLGLLILRGKNPGAKFVALLFILLATLSLARIMTVVYLFWNRPYARGDLFGF